MHPFRKISLFRAFCAGLKHGALPSRAPFKSYPDYERTQSFDCGVRCCAAILACAGICYNFVQESRRIPTTRTPLALSVFASSELTYGSPDAEIPEDTDDDDAECDDPSCGCHDEDEDEDEDEAETK